MSLERKTAHQMRCEQVRERVTRVIGRIPKESRRGGFTKTGVFAERVWKIAVDRGLMVSRNAVTTTTGTPKDLVTGINNFMKGVHGAHETRLDAYELACLEFETEWREARQERRAQLTVVEDTPEVAEAVSEPQDALQEAKIEATRANLGLEPTTRGNAYDPPDEFDAAKTITQALSDFDTPTVKRILRYVDISIESRNDG